ncbi:HD-GYP domain-containing protein [Brevibacillus thermoruber]|jgi:putative nucleotidyltransferase with HDIG domain|uniref:HD-GYP domain-containing protein n=1 Tax=Brevibacillus thermoruber TaxID=33942 RepID=UPI0005521932|nr:HD-GYP domain-containing protein [Brevibacillus thermoruber]
MQLNTQSDKLLQRLIIYAVFPAVVIFMVLLALPHWEPKGHLPVLVAFTLLTIVCSFASFRTPDATLTLNNAVILSGLLLWGEWVAVWSCLLEVIILGFLFRSSVTRTLANAGQMLSTVLIVGWVHTCLEAFHVPWAISDLLLILAYWLVNTLLCAILISYYSSVRWKTAVANMLTRGSATYIMLLIIGGMGARLVDQYGVLALIPLVAAFVIISVVLRQYYESIHKLAQKMDEIKSFNHKFLTAMAASIDARDHYTSGHSQRVAHWGREIARAIGLPEEKAEEVYFGGILHDIGKIGIEDQILNKRGKLTPEEYDKIKQHTVIGYEIILQAGMFHELLPAIRSHHERIDGKGYPDGLVGEEIPLMARILAISDAFDAMVADRPYRKGLPVEEALQEISRGAGTQFDAELAYHFIRIIRQLPRDELETIIRQDAQPQRHLQEVAR